MFTEGWREKPTLYTELWSCGKDVFVVPLLSWYTAEFDDKVISPVEFATYEMAWSSFPPGEKHMIFFGIFEAWGRNASI